MHASDSISIVVPVYNKEDTIRQCLKSLLRQTAANDSYEIVLVNDGSTDNSLALCEQAAAKHGNVRVIDQENQGVSGARNAGMQHARGAWIMFVDADDSISRGTVSALQRCIRNFEDACDVIALNIIYYNPISGRTHPHERTLWMDHTGLYPLADYPSLAQSTINVCVRNRGQDAILFSQGMKMGEDQLFVSENLARCAVLGYCKEAKYTYVRGGGTASRKGNNPLYAFDDMIALYERLLEIGEEQPKMANYVRQLIMYNISWRMESALLFPTFGTPEQQQDMEHRLDAVLQRVTPASVSQSDYLGDFNKAYVLKRFGMLASTTPPAYTGEASVITLADGSIWETHPPTVVIERLASERGNLRIKGRLICPTFATEEKPALSLLFGGAAEDVELSQSSYDYASARLPITKAYSFDTFIDLARVSRDELRFSCSIPGRDIPAVAVENNANVYNARLVDNRAFFPDVVATFYDNSILLARDAGPGDGFAWGSFNAVHPRGYLLRKKAQALIAQHADLDAKRIWVYADLPTSPTLGNAFIQLQHDLQTDDGIERFYISDCADDILEQHPELAGRIVPRKTNMHLYLSLRAEMILSSYLERWIFCPIDLGSFVQLGDLKKNQRRVYLQHGIMHAHIPWYFSYDRVVFDYVVASTRIEVENLASMYCYPEQNIIPAGAPRLDALAAPSRREAEVRKIVFAPSWRSYLVRGNSDEREGDDEAFRASIPYQGMASFLEKVDKSGILDKHDCELHLKLHPNYEAYKHLFEFGNPRIKLAEDNIDERDYSVVITDFSSYVYDFLYGGADVIYFLPDAREFEAGLNHYRELDVPFEEGFGPYCETADDALTALEQTLSNTIPAKDAAAYKQRKEGLFLHHDGKNAERLYTAVKTIADTLQLPAEGESEQA